MHDAVTAECMFIRLLLFCFGISLDHCHIHTSPLLLLLVSQQGFRRIHLPAMTTRVQQLVIPSQGLNQGLHLPDAAAVLLGCQQCRVFADALLLKGHTQLLLYGQLEASHTGVVIYLQVTHVFQSVTHVCVKTRHPGRDSVIAAHPAVTGSTASLKCYYAAVVLS
jgi:hypothetical protein